MHFPHILQYKIIDEPQISPRRNGLQEALFGRLKLEFGEFDRFDTYLELFEKLYQQLHYFIFERIKTKLKMSAAGF